MAFALVSDVRQGAESISGTSDDVAAGMLDLAARSRQQAQALNDSTAAVDELVGRMRDNGTSAHEANALAISAPRRGRRRRRCRRGGDNHGVD